MQEESKRKSELRWEDFHLLSEMLSTGNRGMTFFEMGEAIRGGRTKMIEMGNAIKKENEPQIKEKRSEDTNKMVEYLTKKGIIEQDAAHYYITPSAFMQIVSGKYGPHRSLQNVSQSIVDHALELMRNKKQKQD
jgi:hypothetical protein